MRREWSPEDLIACWTLVDADRALVGNKTGATRLGFVALLTGCSTAVVPPPDALTFTGPGWFTDDTTDSGIDFVNDPALITIRLPKLVDIGGSLTLGNDPASPYLADMLTRFARTENLFPRGVSLPRLET